MENEILNCNITTRITDANYSMNGSNAALHNKISHKTSKCLVRYQFRN